jgi:hypothetical protein
MVGHESMIVYIFSSESRLHGVLSFLLLQMREERFLLDIHGLPGLGWLHCVFGFWDGTLTNFALYKGAWLLVCDATLLIPSIVIIWLGHGFLFLRR